jgi:hypothetical protein
MNLYGTFFFCTGTTLAAMLLGLFAIPDNLGLSHAKIEEGFTTNPNETGWIHQSDLLICICIKIKFYISDLEYRTNLYDIYNFSNMYTCDDFLLKLNLIK